MARHVRRWRTACIVVGGNSARRHGAVTLESQRARGAFLGHLAPVCRTIFTVAGLRHPWMLAFTALVQKAMDIQSDDWQQAGSMDETGTTDPSHIVVYGGPSLQFTLVEPSKGSITFTLAKSDESTLLEVLNRADGLVTD